MVYHTRFHSSSDEAGEGGGFGVEGRDSFDEARHGEGIADAAGAANQVKSALVACQLDRNAYESGDAGTVDLRNAVEFDDDLASAFLDEGIEGLLKLLTGLADGDAAADIENGHSGRIADANLHGDSFGHCTLCLARKGIENEIRYKWSRTHLGPVCIIRWPRVVARVVDLRRSKSLVAPAGRFCKI